MFSRNLNTTGELNVITCQYLVCGLYSKVTPRLNSTSTDVVKSMRTFALVLVFVVSVSWVSNLNAQDRSGYERYLSGLDKNGNQRIDPEEMSGRSREWFRSLGLDTNRSVRIRDVIRLQERKSSERQRRRDREKADKNFSNNVPGFQETLPETEQMQGFGFEHSNLLENSKSNKVGRNQYSSSVIRQADDTLRRYDRNKNGVLEREEIERGRWSNPPWTDSDTNKDRRLSRNELLERYKRRESNWSGSSSSSRSRFGRSSSNRSSSSRSSNWRSNSSGSYSSYTKRSSSRSGSSSSDNNSYYPKYVKGIIAKYDKNKDGLLSSSELSKMSRAPKNADTNKDGKLSYDEMLNHYTKGSSSKSSSSSRSSTGSRFGKSRGSYSSRSFSSNDKNRDGQIAMHEFTDKWDDEILNEFNRLDQNGDGFISKHEFDASKGKKDESSSSSKSKRNRFSRNR